MSHRMPMKVKHAPTRRKKNPKQSTVAVRSLEHQINWLSSFSLVKTLPQVTPVKTVSASAGAVGGTFYIGIVSTVNR